MPRLERPEEEDSILQALPGGFCDIIGDHGAIDLVENADAIVLQRDVGGKLELLSRLEERAIVGLELNWLHAAIEEVLAQRESQANGGGNAPVGRRGDKLGRWSTRLGRAPGKDIKK